MIATSRVILAPFGTNGVANHIRRYLPTASASIAGQPLANFKMTNCRGTGNTTRGISFGTAFERPLGTTSSIEDCVCSWQWRQHHPHIGFRFGATGGRITNALFVNNNVSAYTWGSTSFPSPWNTGWSVDIWRGSFNPTVTTRGSPRSRIMLGSRHERTAMK